HLRDARIAPIYEGTNGIQANDLVGRKLARDHGAAAAALCADIAASVTDIENIPGSDLAEIAAALRAALTALDGATRRLADSEPVVAAAGSTPYLQLTGTVCGGWLMARQAAAAARRLAAGPADTGFLSTKLATARFYAEHFLALAPAYVP